jgi:hypothetical protein
MRRVKQASRKKRITKAAAVTGLGAAGLGLSLFGSASGSTMPAADIPQSDNTSPNQRFVLGEEEMGDSVSPRSISSIRKKLAATCKSRGAAAAVAVAAEVAELAVAAELVAAVAAGVAAAAAHAGDGAAGAKSQEQPARLQI